MYSEICCYDKNSTDNDIREMIFAAAKHKLGSVGMPSYFISSNKEFIEPESGLTISSPVDFPNGSSDKQIRNSMVLSTIKKGATVIDIPINSHMYLNRQLDRFALDIESNVKICKEHNAKLRVFLDYQLFELDELITIGKTLGTLGVDEAFVSPGLDDWKDNLTVAVMLQKKTGLNMITNGNFWKREHYDEIKKSKVFGIRFRSMSILRNIFGV